MENESKEFIGGAPRHMTSAPAQELDAKLDDALVRLKKLEILLSALISVHPEQAAIVKKAKEDLAK